MLFCGCLNMFTNTVTTCYFEIYIIILRGYLMSAEEKLIQRINSAGSIGAKRTDLRREFTGEEIDVILENLLTHGQIFMDKKGAAYYYWHKDHYIQSLLNSDQKFRLMYEAIISVEQSVNKSSDALAKAMDMLVNDVLNLTRSTVGKNQHEAWQKELTAQLTIPVDQFKNEFDTTIANYSNSIGWVELAKIRNDLCGKLNIPNEEFYHLVDQLTSTYQERYELSTGGNEGLTVRGLLHGFVRCI